MSVRIYANKIAQLHAGADERRKTETVIAAVQLYIIFPPGRQRFTLTDNCTGLIGNLPLSDGILKKRIGKAERPVMRHNMKGIVKYKQRTFQQRTGVGSQRL